MLNTNLILATDSYKVSHYMQQPTDVSYMEYYVESRGGLYDELMVAGVQLLINILAKGITQEDIDEAESILQPHMGVFNKEGWEYILSEHGGKLPLNIFAPKEGTLVPTKNAFILVVSTDPLCAWLPGYFESLVLQTIWYSTTVASISFHAKRKIKEFLAITCDNPEAELPFKLHDFGFRGVSSTESAGAGGLAHLYNFKGTDTLEALRLARVLYPEEACAGFSIPAREHSTTTSWGISPEAEKLAFENSVDNWCHTTYACVMDSFDYEAALETVTTGALKDKIISKGGTFVCRPDSGNPVDVVMKALEIIAKNVGFTYNSKGYKVLHPSYRIIQGDGVDGDEIGRILNWMEANKWSAENVAFGMGGGLLQQCDRDTQRFAMKCSFLGLTDDTSRDVFKAPKTDMSKASKRGQLDLVKSGDGKEIKTVRIQEDYQGFESILTLAFHQGHIVLEYISTLAEVRRLSDKQV